MTVIEIFILKNKFQLQRFLQVGNHSLNKSQKKISSLQIKKSLILVVGPSAIPPPPIEKVAVLREGQATMFRIRRNNASNDIYLKFMPQATMFMITVIDNISPYSLVDAPGSSFNCNISSGLVLVKLSKQATPQATHTSSAL